MRINSVTPGTLQSRVAAAALAFVLLAAGCGGGDANAPTATAGAEELVLNGGETREDAEKGGFALQGREITAPGPTIRVRAGARVRITFENVHGAFHGESVPHDFVVVAEKDIPVPLSAADVLWGAKIALYPSPLDPGERGSVTFTPDAPGTFYYICSVPGHVGRGMWGRFIVEG
jgi:nitrite reductase (NO-forming)